MPLNLRKFTLLASIAVLASACVLRLGDGDTSYEDDLTWEDDGAYEDDLTWEDDTDVTSSSAGGQGGQGGSGEAGGSGGAGGGEDIYCNDGEGDLMSDVCDGLPVAGEDCDGFTAVGFAACQRGFEIYEPGHAAELASCLWDIQVEDACEMDPVDSCFSLMYEQACDDDFIAETCDEFQLACNEFGEDLDLARCNFELKPFSDAGLAELVNCINDEDTAGDCQQRYDVCLDLVFTID